MKEGLHEFTFRLSDGRELSAIDTDEAAAFSKLAVEQRLSAGVTGECIGQNDV